MSDAAELAARALKHFNEGTTDRAPSQMRIPVSAYTDEAQFQAERQAVFFESPIAVALSLEIPKPGDFLTQTIMGKPLLFTRDKEGVLHCFINVCRHRGAKVCATEKGHQSRFSCPYHAWTYSNKGELIGVYGEDSFGDVDRASMGLAELPCDERSGVIFACLTPGEPLDLDNWLGEFASKLADQNLEQWHLYTERFLSGAGWKATLDGYLEVYHHDSVHGKTVGPYTVGNLLVHDTWGAHQRMVIARKDITKLNDIAPENWEAPESYIRVVHSVFPNLSISAILGGQCLIGFVYPGETSTTTVTRQLILSAEAPETDEQKATIETFSQMTLQAVRDEDYALVATIQGALHAGANDSFLIGRNEPAVQHYHRSIASISGT
ncbi:aromatic ring-hydroxylating dioxygenase subunit alpha [Luminiphilus sp.]|jgi:phenylpropionate dioxygenase-like ring-hydroxylating dioxygenase large terminal subunit|nr:aromatic ring-hydroxylating dioxygenase subunit alpha [Luminiphilus sp.]MDB2689083.1 aromatic ring-hydroxylating dioxygenase subunit alpha [Luminiphilus sp.]MDC0572121.1 aromatic ring-hydroxylating dioxygenase subunit alpha [Luminiphilus sp.]MDC1161051.1 aromatic ring-hydroxylating dioxygenase subunit alpha [Luminiphilus sp.]